MPLPPAPLPAKLCLTGVGLALLTASISYGNLRLAFDTDGSGMPTVGSFTGVGAVDANIVTGVTAGGNRDIIGLGNGAVLGVDVIASATQSFTPPIQMDTTFAISGGTADLRLNRNNAQGVWKGWNIDNLENVTSFGFTSVFSQPINPRDNPTFITGLPWGFSSGLFVEGTGFDPDDFDVTYTIGGLQYSPTVPATTSSLGGAPAYTPFSSAGWDNASTPSTLAFNSSDGFLGTTGGGNDINNLLVRGFDDENTGFDSTDDDQFFATSFSVEITPLAAVTFAPDTEFVFSFDGDSLLVVEDAIPEPSRAVLMAIGFGMLVLARRRRKNS